MAVVFCQRGFHTSRISSVSVKEENEYGNDLLPRHQVGNEAAKGVILNAQVREP